MLDISYITCMLFENGALADLLVRYFDVHFAQDTLEYPRRVLMNAMKNGGELTRVDAKMFFFAL